MENRACPNKKTARHKLILAAGCLFKSYRISPLEAITSL